MPLLLSRVDSLPSAPGAEQRGTLSPSLRCSAASLVSWESEMKHCSSGREKLFCGRCLDVVSGSGACGHQEGRECFHSPYGQLRKLLDSSPTCATICFMILGKA